MVGNSYTKGALPFRWGVGHNKLIAMNYVNHPPIRLVALCRTQVGGYSLTLPSITLLNTNKHEP